MAEGQADFALPAYEQAQQSLFSQVLSAVRVAVIMVLLMILVAWLFPGSRTTPMVLLAGLVVVEFGIAEISSRLVRRGHVREGALFFVVATLLVVVAVASVLQSPIFAAVATGVLIAISALLIGPRYSVVPGVIGTLLFVALSVAVREGWLSAIAIAQESSIAFPVEIGFVVAATAVLVVVCALASDRLQQIARDAQSRAAEAERARVGQAALNERLEREIGEQRRLLEVIHELETPIMPIRGGVLVLPLVGHLDSRRLEQVESRLLQRVAADRAELVLIDVTGVVVVDTSVVGGLVRLVQAVRLLGPHVALTGLQPATAHTLAQMGVDLSFARTYATIQDALAQVDSW